MLQLYVVHDQHNQQSRPQMSRTHLLLLSGSKFTLHRCVLDHKVPSNTADISTNLTGAATTCIAEGHGQLSTQPPDVPQAW
jgi:hypothetical protein